MTIVASSPGKLVLIGEYAVLFGAPALVVAVNRRAEVRLEPVPGTVWSVAAPGLAEVPTELEIAAAGRVRWGDPELATTTFKLVDRLLEAMGDAGRLARPRSDACAVTLDTRQFFAAEDGRRKLGLGSSAALTTALVTALGRLEEDRVEDENELTRLSHLVALHRAVQGGRGSGIDVAASLLGGVVRYRLDDGGGVAEAARCSLPADLHCRFIWTGRAARTAEFLERLEDARATDRAAVDAVLAELASTSERGIAAVDAGAGGDFLAAADGFVPVLDALGLAIGMPVVSPQHRTLWRLASRLGVSYKPSGAGGGDFGLALALDRDRLEGFCEEASNLGSTPVDLAVDTIGTSVTVR